MSDRHALVKGPSVCFWERTQLGMHVMGLGGQVGGCITHKVRHIGLERQRSGVEL